MTIKRNNKTLQWTSNHMGKVHPLPRNHEVGIQHGTRHSTSSPKVLSLGHCSGLEIVDRTRPNIKAQYEVGLTTIGPTYRL